MQGEAHDDVVFFVAFLECSLPEETLMFAMGVVEVAEEREVKGPREEERPRILAGKGAARHATRKPDSGGSEAVPLSLPPFYRRKARSLGSLNRIRMFWLVQITVSSRELVYAETERERDSRWKLGEWYLSDWREGMERRPLGRAEREGVGVQLVFSLETCTAAGRRRGDRWRRRRQRRRWFCGSRLRERRRG